MSILKSFRHPAEEPYLLSGFILLAISFLVFAPTMQTESFGWDIFTQSFFVNYGIFVVYLIMLMIRNRAEYGGIFKFKSLAHNLLLLELANLSAYSLNRSIPVFQVSTDWLVHYLLIYNLAILLFILRKDRRPDSINLSLLLLISSGIVFQLYESSYIVPFYGFGLVACWFFGISLHVFIPLWFLIASARIAGQYLRYSPRYKPVFWLGLFMPVFMISLVSIRWAQLQGTISDHYQRNNALSGAPELPVWVQVSQELPRDWVSKRILKSGLVYKTANLTDLDLFPPMSSINERRQHDPLVMVASFFGGDLAELPDEDRLALLRAVLISATKPNGNCGGATT